MSVDWQQQAERSNTFTLKLITWIAMHTGRGFTRILLYPIVLYYLITAPSARAASRLYLQRVFKRPATFGQVARHIYTFAATILDRVFFLTDRTDSLDIKVHNYEVIKKYREQNQGVILLGTHLGSFEAMRCLAQTSIKTKLKIVMYQQHNQMITQVLEALNPEVARNVIDLAEMNALLQVNEALDEGFMIGMLGDRVGESDKVTKAKLLGTEAEFPQGIMLIASSLKVPVIMFFCLYMGGNRYEIYFEELAEKIEIPRTERETNIHKWVQKYVDRIEFYINKAPYNWFNFYNFWHDK